ncbi:MAG: hypothetical protein Q9190_006738 [Brigantiaea leucoxantha]
MALAVFSRVQRYPQAAAEASSTYHRLLRVAQEQVGTVTLHEQNIDGCLLAAFLMGRYECATYYPALKSKDSFKSLPLWSHHDGAMAILKVWSGSPNHMPATSIIKQTRRGLIRSSLLRDLPLPGWMLDGSLFGEHDRDLDYDRIFVQTVSLFHEFKRLQQSSTLVAAKAEELSRQAQGLDKALQDWAARLPSTWSHFRHIIAEPGPWPKNHLYSPIVYSYSKIGYAATWSKYFAVRMLVNSMCLRVLKLSRSSLLVDFAHESQLLECAFRLKEMADSLASTIPFCLERIKVADKSKTAKNTVSVKLCVNEEIKPYLANLMVWPLTIASSLEGVDSRQQLWFRSELARLGTLTGAGNLERAESDQWVRI